MKKNSQTRPNKRSTPVEPRLGIFWLVKDSLLIDSLPLSACEQYDNHLTYPHGHIDVWERWRQAGKAPAESEYEEYGRGRVTCDVKTKTFTLLADRCILRRKDLIAKIKEELSLPKQTTLGTDPHYRCFTCLHGTDDGE